jgi:phage repressor protein C with HTH and peptisase S24 domain
VGVSPQAVQKWLAGESEPRGANLTKAAAFLGVSPSFLKFGTASIDDVVHALPSEYSSVITSGSSNPDYIEIRTVKLRLSAGITGFAVEEPEIADTQPMSLSKAFIDQHGLDAKNLVAVKVKGESMEPTLYEGDLVVFNAADRSPKDGIVYAINYEGELVVKRMQRDIGRWWLSSDNPNQRQFPRKVCEGGECLILGRIISRQSFRI